LNVQHKLAKEWLLEVGYVGSHGNKLSKRWPVNQAHVDVDPENPTPVASRTPFPRFGAPLGSFKAGISNYNALQVRLEKSFSHGLYLVSGYTFSRCQDMDSSASFAADTQNIYDLKDDYGLCGFQVKNRANVSFGWEIPLGRSMTGVAGKLVKGWQLNSIVQLQDGSPFTPIVSGIGANVGAWTNTRANRTCDGNLPDSEQTVTEFFDTSCFQFPQVGRFGNSGRNGLFSPGYKSADFSLFKNTYLSERTYIQFRAEFFNAFNFSNYNQPGRRLGAFSFGRITSETDAREIQFGLKIIF
jgi:hypothetical protein